MRNNLVSTFYYVTYEVGFVLSGLQSVYDVLQYYCKEISLTDDTDRYPQAWVKDYYSSSKWHFNRITQEIDYLKKLTGSSNSKYIRDQANLFLPKFIYMKSEFSKLIDFLGNRINDSHVPSES